jgi:hypothetical protein
MVRRGDCKTGGREDVRRRRGEEEKRRSGEVEKWTRISNSFAVLTSYDLKPRILKHIAKVLL